MAMIKNKQGLLIAASAAAFMAFAPVSAHAASVDVEISDFDFDFDSEDLFEELVALNANDIATLQGDFEDARYEILDAIDEVHEAREEIRSVPFIGIFVRAVFRTAGSASLAATQSAFDGVESRLDDAENKLFEEADRLGPDETAETGEAISVIREGILGLQDALGELLSAMSA